MATVWDWVILMIVFGLVSTFEIGLIGSIIGRIIESKMKVKTELNINYYERTMEKLEETLEKYFKEITKLFKKDEQPKIEE